MRRVLLAAFLATLGTQAAGMGLLEAFRAAQENDADFRSLRLERDAARLNADIAFGGLLPNVSASFAQSLNKGDRTFTGSGLQTTQPLDYQARIASLNLRQPLYNSELMVRYRQGKAQGSIADASLDGRRLELASTVAGAYFDVLLARDAVALGEAEVQAAQEQMQLARRRFEAGEGTLTEIAEAQARRDLADAKLLEARDQSEVAIGIVERLTGAKRPALHALKPGAVGLNLDPATLAQWSELARERNPDVVGRRLQVENAALEVDRNRAGHLPRVDLVASVTDAKNDTLNTLNTTSTIRSAGVQLTVPIFAGGTVSASTDQAAINHARAQASVDASMNAAVEKVRKQYLAAVSASARISAYDKAVQSATESLKGTRLGFQSGIRTNLDVLNAQSQLFAARRDLAQARYAYLIGVVALKAAAGVLDEDAMAQIDRLLEPASR